MESKRYIATVVSIDDPDKNGRSKVRIHGKHDDKTNIPDKDLPWAIPTKGTDDPAINKIGSGGNGLLVGSKVFVEFWDNGVSGQHLYITGSIPKSGDEKKGQTKDGSTSVDTSKGDTPSASRGKDVNPAASNPIKDSKTTPGKDTDEGKNIYNESRDSSKFKDLPTIGMTEAREILSVIKKIDPKNLGGIFPSFGSSMSAVSSINASNSTPGNLILVSKLLADSFFELIKKYSRDRIDTKIESLLSKDNPLNIVEGQYLFSTDENIINIIKEMLVEVKNLEEEKDDSILEIDETILPLYANIKPYVLTTLDLNIKNYTLTKPIFLDIVYNALALTKTNAEQDVSTSAPTSGLSGIPNVNLGAAIQKFIKSMGILEKKEKELEKLFKDTVNTIENKFKSIKGITDPKTGNKNE